jgi:hypothetical protein
VIQGAVHLVVLVEIFQETLVDGVQADENIVSLGPAWLVTAGPLHSRASSPWTAASSAWAVAEDCAGSDQYQDGAGPQQDPVPGITPALRVVNVRGSQLAA